MKKTVSTILRALVSVSLIVILLYIMRDKYSGILETLKGANVSVFLLSLLVFTLALGAASFRLKLIINAQDMQVTYLESVSLTFIGYFFNNFLPTAIGGDVVKAYYLSKKSNQKTACYTSVFVDRAIGLFTMIFMAFVAVFFVSGAVIDGPARYVIYSITFVSIFAIAFASNKNLARKFSVVLKALKPIEEKLVEAYNAVHGYRHHKILIFQSVLISVVSQMLFFTSIGIIAVSIGSKISIMEILLRMPIISAMSLLPSINGLGLREGSTVVMFAPLIGKASAFAVSILWLAALFIVSVAGGLIYAISPQFKVKLKEIE